MGFDLSTQSLTCTVVDARLKVVSEESLSFDGSLPWYQTKGGANKGPDGSMTSPTLMWVEALDLLLSKMKDNNFPFHLVTALSASGQQHGSVYWKNGARDILDHLDSKKTLKEQLNTSFSITQSPIWMDSTTTQYCQEIERLMGGAQEVASLTGSKCFERFTVNQIAKVYRNNTKAYNETERISLVSSFFISLFLSGKYANIDGGDGSGMNIMNLKSKKWVPKIIEYAGTHLEKKLGEVVYSYQTQGFVSKYFQERFNFSSSCLVVTATGDNPSTLAGLKLHEGDIAVSLGTSSTLFGPLMNPVPSADEGNIMVNPVVPNGYMAMICYKNGALAREQIRDRYASSSWELFSEYLKSSKPGNEGRIGFYFSEPEIIPYAKGCYYFNSDDTLVPAWEDPKVHVRAIVESQILSMYLHSSNIGLKATQGILVTGGSSKNPEILQILCDIFGVKVYTGDQPNSASLGAALRAYHSKQCEVLGRFEDYHSLVGSTSFKLSATPNTNNHLIYQQMLKRYKTLEEKVIQYAKTTAKY
uniref:Xylulose kinase n=1 Tax=Arcella intermedia TaxID=1963864 RepID=A0A6B2L1E7_9EUKA